MPGASRGSVRPRVLLELGPAADGARPTSASSSPARSRPSKDAAARRSRRNSCSPASVTRRAATRRSPGLARRVTKPARSRPSRWWVRVGCRMPTARGQLGPGCAVAADFSAWSTSQVGAEPPAAASASSRARSAPWRCGRRGRRGRSEAHGSDIEIERLDVYMWLRGERRRLRRRDQRASSARATATAAGSTGSARQPHAQPGDERAATAGERAAIQAALAARASATCSVPPSGRAPRPRAGWPAARRPASRRRSSARRASRAGRRRRQQAGAGRLTAGLAAHRHVRDAVLDVARPLRRKPNRSYQPSR